MSMVICGILVEYHGYHKTCYVEGVVWAHDQGLARIPAQIYILTGLGYVTSVLDTYRIFMETVIIE